MTHKVLKSEIMRAGIDNFPAAVAAHVKELRLWEDQEALVGAGKAQRYPRPQGHPAVDAAVRRIESGSGVEIVPDFEVVDDTPAPPSMKQVMRERKNQLLTMIANVEIERRGDIVPTGKVRHTSITEMDIRAADNQRKLGIINKRVGDYRAKVDKLNDGVGDDKKKAEAVAALGAPYDEADVEREAISQRPSGDAKFMADYETIRGRFDRLTRWAAKQQHDIEDLTAETIDAWKPESIPE